MNPVEEDRLQSWIVSAINQEYNILATAEDIFFCFRLLLGRHPDSSEWEGHSVQIGYELESVVASYLNSLEFSRRGLSQSEKINSLEIVDFEGIRIYANSKDPIIGAQIARGNYEPEIVALFKQILQPGMGVIDIGANIGYFTMLAASLVGTEGFVLAVEPNLANVQMIEASRRLNAFDQITTLQAAAGSSIGLLAFHATHSTGVTSPIQAGGHTVLDHNLVSCLPVDRVISRHRKIGLIKIDVDGSEYHALRGVTDLINRDRPIIITEFFPGGLQGLSGIDGYAYMQWLNELGYRISVIQADGSTLDVSNPDQVARILEARGSDHLDLICHPVGRDLPAGPPDEALQNASPTEGGNHEALIRAEQRCHDLETELNWLRGHLEAANLHARDAEDRARKATKQFTAASIQSSALEAAATEMRKGLEAANIREREASSLLAACQTSTSWQLTGPLRSAVNLLRRSHG